MEGMTSVSYRQQAISHSHFSEENKAMPIRMQYQHHFLSKVKYILGMGKSKRGELTLRVPCPNK